VNGSTKISLISEKSAVAAAAAAVVALSLLRQQVVKEHEPLLRVEGHWSFLYTALLCGCWSTERCKVATTTTTMTTQERQAEPTKNGRGWLLLLLLLLLRASLDKHGVV
jgi:hypothetical protein